MQQQHKEERSDDIIKTNQDKKYSAVELNPSQGQSFSQPKGHYFSKKGGYLLPLMVSN
jgi:hypothetical protein